MVLERYAGGADDVGSWLQVASNGIAALELIGLEDEAVGLGPATNRLRTRTATGAISADMPLGLQRDSGPLTRSLLRADLYRILRTAAEAAGVDLLPGVEVARVKQSQTSATAVDHYGARWTGDVVVGADGANSAVRVGMGDDLAKSSTPSLLNVGGIANSVDTQLTPPLGTLQFVYGADLFVGSVRADDASTWWFANPRPSVLPRSDQAPTDRVDGAGWRATLARMASTIPVGELLGATEELSVWPNRGRARRPCWGMGRVVLIGDAAHAIPPSSGQGASLALEDAVVLGNLLFESRGEYRVAERLMAVRDDRIRAITRQGELLDRSKRLRPVGSWLRDHVVLPLAARQTARSGQSPAEWMYTFPAG